MTNQIRLLSIFYDPEEDCFGYEYHLKDYNKDDLIKILKELNNAEYDVLTLLGDKENEA